MSSIKNQLSEKSEDVKQNLNPYHPYHYVVRQNDYTKNISDSIFYSGLTI